MLTLALTAALGSGARHLERKPEAPVPPGITLGATGRDLYGRRLDPVIDCGHIALQRVMDAGVDHCESLELHPEVGVPHALENALGAVAASCDHLRTLRFGGGPHLRGIGDAGVRLLAGARGPLRNCPVLTHLDVGRSGLSDDAMAPLFAALAVSNVTYVDLASNQIGRAGAEEIEKVLEKNISLLELNLADNWLKIMGAKAIGRAVSRNPPLRRLSLRRNLIFDKGCDYLGEALRTNTHLRRLNLAANGIIGCDKLVASMNASALTALDLGHNERNATHNSALAADLAAALVTNAALRELHLGHMWVGPEGAAAFAAPLAANHSGLEVLHLGMVGPGPDGAVAHGGALKANRRLRTLRMATHHQGFYEVGAIGVAALEEGLAENDHLTMLQLGLERPYSKHPLDAIAIEASLSKIHDHLEHNRHHERRRQYDDHTAATGAPNRHHDHHRAPMDHFACDARTGTCEAMDASEKWARARAANLHDRDDDAAVSGVWVPKGGRLPTWLADAPPPPSAAGGDGGGGSWVPGTYAAFHGESECWHCVLPFKGA